MPEITIKIGSKNYSYNASDSEDAGLHLAWEKVMKTLPEGEKKEGSTETVPLSEREGYIDTASGYLEKIIADWAVSNPSDDVETMMKQCISSWDTSPDVANNQAVPLVETVMDESTKKALLLAYAADKRWKKETGGTVIGGIPMSSDRETQSKLTAAFLLAQFDSKTVFSWKVGGDFVEISADMVKAIAVGVGKFVQACYKAESVVIEEINNGTIVSEADIDAFAWPE